MKNAPQQKPQSSPTFDAARRGRSLVAVLASCSSFAWGCEETTGTNGPADGSSDGPSVDGSGALISETGADSGGNDGALPACIWPASLDDAAPPQCSAARAYVACEYPGGSGYDCMSNDPTTCPGASGASCTDLCHANEYAVGCGGIGLSSPPLPAGCRSLPPDPGGGVAGCCPCGAVGTLNDGGTVNEDAGGDGATGSVNDGGSEASDGGQVVPASDAPQPTPDAFVLASVGPGVGSTVVCAFQSDQTLVEIGLPTDPKPSTVTSGAVQAGSGALGLSCKVDPSGGGFNIQLSAKIGGSNGGSFIAVGQVTTSGGSGIQGTFTSATAGTFSDSNCSITFTYNHNPVPVTPSLAAGRIWGHIDCPNAMNPVSSVTDGGPAICDGRADFLFENCQ